MTLYKTSNGQVEIEKSKDAILWKHITLEGYERIFKITVHDAGYLAEEVDQQMADQSALCNIDIPIVGSKQNLSFKVKTGMTEIVEPGPGDKPDDYTIPNTTMTNIVQMLYRHCQAVAPARN